MKKLLMSIAGLGESIPIPPDGERAVSFFLEGQSNALGRADALSLPIIDQQPQDRIYIFNDPFAVQFVAGEFGDNTGQYGLELFLAQLLRDYHDAPVYIFKKGVGGSKLAVTTGVANDWNLSTDELWLSGKNRYTRGVKAAKSVNLNPENKLFIWYQGESDGVLQSDADAYQVNEQAIFDDLRGFMGDVNYSIVDVLPISDYGTYSPVVRTAKTNISSLDSNIFNGDAEGLNTLDGTHLSEQGLRDLADNIFEIVKDFWSF